MGREIRLGESTYRLGESTYRVWLSGTVLKGRALSAQISLSTHSQKLVEQEKPVRHHTRTTNHSEVPNDVVARPQPEECAERGR